MIKKSVHVIAIVFFMLIAVMALSSCGAKYNTDFPPPAPNAGLDDVFPADIGGQARVVTPLELPGKDAFEAVYGPSAMTIRVIQNQTPEEADGYFQTGIVPAFDAMPTYSRAQVNGRWYASGKDKDGRKWYGWVNQNWIFVISGSSEDNFNKILENFRFIKNK